jgi:transmembrane sensor
MPDLMGRIERAAAAIDPRLTDRDVDRLVQGAARRRKRRASARAALAATAGLAVVAGVAGGPLLRYLTSAPAATIAASAMDGAVRLRDGSIALPLEAGSTLALVREAPERVELSLGRGRARFDVVPKPERAFLVSAGDVTVTVLGTAFTVERVADRVGVTVERGTVRVDWKVGTRLLRKGESGWFPPLLVEGAPAAVSKDEGAPPRPRLAAKHDPEPRHLAGREAPVETAEGLLAQADAERLAGRPERGATLLRRLLRDHGRDKRAPLAAFTLGRLLLIELDRPREAAAAFAEVRVLAPGGSFAEDALAREVEAWQRVGDVGKMRARAREYVQLYPDGRRVDTVRILGEIE